MMMLVSRTSKPFDSRKLVTLVAAALATAMLCAVVIHHQSAAPDNRGRHVTSSRTVLDAKVEPDAAAEAAEAKAEVEKIQGKVMQVATAGFLDLFKCVEAGCKGITTLQVVAKTAATTALSLIPVVGPFISGLVGVFWPDKKKSVWQQIKKQVKESIGSAIRELEVEWVERDMNAIK